MKVAIDHALCEGYRECVKNAPEIFEVADDDVNHLLIDEPGEEYRAKIEMAVKCCPKQALSIQE